MVADCLEQVGHGCRLVRASGSWYPIGLSKSVKVSDWLVKGVMVADWLEQVGHGSRLVRASGSWWPIG